MKSKIKNFLKLWFAVLGAMAVTGVILIVVAYFMKMSPEVAIPVTLIGLSLLLTWSLELKP